MSIPTTFYFLISMLCIHKSDLQQGLNLDDCNSAYHQIQRTHQQGPYQDVANCGEDIQLEKPQLELEKEKEEEEPERQSREK